MNVDAGTLANVQRIVARTKDDLSEARALGPVAAPLVAKHTAMAALHKKTMSSIGQTAEALTEAESAERAAAADLTAAHARYQAGSMDRAVALALRDDFEHARQVLVIRERELAIARKLAASPLQAIIRSGIDRGRDESKRKTEAIVDSARSGQGYSVDTVLANSLEPGELEWHVFHEARALASYKATAERRGDKSWPVSKLEEIFAIRRNQYASQHAALQSRAAQPQIAAGAT